MVCVRMWVDRVCVLSFFVVYFCFPGSAVIKRSKYTNLMVVNVHIRLFLLLLLLAGALPYAVGG